MAVVALAVGGCSLAGLGFVVRGMVQTERVLRGLERRYGLRK